MLLLKPSITMATTAIPTAITNATSTNCGFCLSHQSIPQAWLPGLWIGAHLLGTRAGLYMGRSAEIESDGREIGDGDGDKDADRCHGEGDGCVKGDGRDIGGGDVDSNGDTDNDDDDGDDDDEIIPR